MEGTIRPAFDRRTNSRRGSIQGRVWPLKREMAMILSVHGRR